MRACRVLAIRLDAMRPSTSTRRHPMIEGFDPPEGWGWCYVDEVMFDISDRMTPTRPIPRFY